MFEELEKQIRSLVAQEISALKNEFEELRQDCESSIVEMRKELQQQTAMIPSRFSEDHIGHYHICSDQNSQPTSLLSTSFAAPKSYDHKEDQHSRSTLAITINVGGDLFTTLPSTLQRVPGSFLDILINGRHEVARDESGRLFIDRTPRYFESILAWMRDPGAPCNLPFHDPEFLHELEYYGLSDAILGDRSSDSDSVSFSGVIYAVGSEGPSERYDLDRNIWFPMADMIHPRMNCTFVWFNGCLYCVGGADRQRVYANIERFDPRKNRWVPVPDMEIPRKDPVCIVQHGHLYVLGGFDHDGNTIRDVEKYDPELRAWQRLASLHTCAGKMACIIVREKLFAFGGSTLTDASRTYTPLTAVEMFDEEQGLWAACLPMPRARFEVNAAVVGAKVVIAGGLASGSTSSALAKTDIYDTEANSWTTGKDMNHKRFSVACCAAIGNMVYIAGGSNPVALETVERYDIEADTWTLLPTMHQPRHFFAATVFQGRLLTVGGMSYRRDRRSQRVGATMPVTTVEAYDPAANRWFRLAPLNYARSHGVCITASLE